MSGIDEIPTAPNTPGSYSPYPSGDDMSDEPFDMISSIESLTPSSRPGTPALAVPDSDRLDGTRAIESARASDSRASENVAYAHGIRRSPVLRRSMASDSHGFVMPSSPSGSSSSASSPSSSSSSSSPSSSSSSSSSPSSATAPATTPGPAIPGSALDWRICGDLRIALAGNMSASGDSLTEISNMFSHQAALGSDQGIETCTCVSPPGAQNGTVRVYDASYGNQCRDSVQTWSDSESRQNRAVHVVVYSLDGSAEATQEDIHAMRQIQKMAVLVSMADSPISLVCLARKGIHGFRQQIWNRRRSSELVTTLLDNSEQIRAMAASLQSEWYESQLVMTTSEPAGALCQRVNLRCKASESIDNLDPLGLSSWAMLSKSAVMSFSGAVASSLTAFGVTCVWSKLMIVPVPPTPRRHALFDMEDWPQWLVQ